MPLKRDLSSSAASSPFTSPKRPRRDASQATTRPTGVLCALQVAQLPPNVFARILAFAVPGFVPAAQSVPLCPNLPIRRFRAIAGVSREWMLAARSVVQHFVCSTLDWELLAAPSLEDVEELRNELKRRGEQLLDLRLTLDAKLRSKDLAVLDWCALLSACPKLQRLDLRGVPLEHRALGQILDAAAAKCLELAALVLPKRSASAKQSAINASYEQLADALESWSARGSKLKQLTIPDRQTDEAEASSSTLLTILAESCSSLEYLDGWKSDYRVDGFVECSEKWYVPLPVWTQFCTALGGSLREFNWAVAPFHDEYMRVFAASRKPQLQHLCLTVSESWSWEDFKLRCEEEDEEDDDKDKGEKSEDEEKQLRRLPEELVAAPTAETLCELARALPGLEQLHVILHANMEDPSTIDTEAFGDAFLTNLACTCLALRELKVVELSAGEELSAIESISSAGIAALSGLESLQDVVITGVQGQPLDVFAFIQHWHHPQRQRTVTIGLDQGESERAFYDEALDLLTKIRDEFCPKNDGDNERDDEDEHGEDSMTRGSSVPPRKFAVKLRNLTAAPDFKHLKRFCKSWNRLVRELETTLPWLRIAAESDGVLEDGPVSAFSSIGEVVVASRDANLAVFGELSVLTPTAAVLATPKRKKSHQSERAAPTSVKKRLELPSSDEHHSSSEDDDASDYGSVADGDTASEDSDIDSPTKSVPDEPGSESDFDDRLSVADDSEEEPPSADASLEVVAIDSEEEQASADESLEVMTIDSN